MPEVHEPEPTPLDEKDWLRTHPRVQGAIIISKRIIIPILVIVLPLYFNNRINNDKEKSTDGYGELAQAIKKLQDAQLRLEQRLQPTQQLVLAEATKPPPAVPNPALEQYKKALVVKVQKSQAGELT